MPITFSHIVVVDGGVATVVLLSYIIRHWNFSNCRWNRESCAADCPGVGVCLFAGPLRRVG